MINKEAMEYFAKVMGKLPVAATKNIGGRDVANGYMCSLAEPGCKASFTATVQDAGVFEVKLLFWHQQILLVADTNKVGFEEICLGFKAAYDKLREYR